jgi:hypothetical protein
VLLETVNFPNILQKIRQAKTIQKEVVTTTSLFETAKGSLASLGIKTSNLTKLVHQIKTSNLQLGQVFFKNTSGVLSINPTQISQQLDSAVRPIIEPLLVRDITDKGLEISKKAQVASIEKQMLVYGMKKTEFYDILNKITSTTTQLNYYVYSKDGYLLETGDVENPSSYIEEDSTIILKFEVVGTEGSLLMDSSLTSEISGANVSSMGVSSVEVVDGRNAAKFVGLTTWNIAINSIGITSDQRFVDVEDTFVLEMDFKLKKSEEVEAYSFMRSTIVNVYSLFVLQIKKESGQAAGNFDLVLSTGSYSELRIDNQIQTDQWYKLKISFWYDSVNAAYRKEMKLTNISTNETRIARNYYSAYVNNITSTVMYVGFTFSDLAAFVNSDNVNIESQQEKQPILYIDNFSVKTSNVFDSPQIVEGFDQTKTSPKISISNSKQNLALNSSSTTWVSSVSEKSAYTGRKYFEVKNLANEQNCLVVGLIQEEMNNLAADFYPGKYTNSFGIVPNRAVGVITYGGYGSTGQYDSRPALVPIEAGGIVRVAVDFDMGVVWFGVGEDWASYEPPSISLGSSSYASYSFTVNQAMKICVALKGSLEQISLNVGARPFEFPVPERFVAWGDIGVI